MSYNKCLTNRDTKKCMDRTVPRDILKGVKICGFLTIKQANPHS